MAWAITQYIYEISCNVSDRIIPVIRKTNMVENLGKYLNQEVLIQRGVGEQERVYFGIVVRVEISEDEERPSYIFLDNTKRQVILRDFSIPIWPNDELQIEIIE